MQPAGAHVMLVSVATVTGLFLWCVWRVLTSPGDGPGHAEEENGS